MTLKNQTISSAAPQITNWVGIGAYLLGLSVAAGALGAHLLRAYIDTDIFDKAVRYQSIHSFALIVTALLVQANFIPAKRADTIAKLFLAGIVLFSGSLYLLAITGAKWLGAITPFGGAAFITGWILLGRASHYKLRSPS